MAMYWTHVFIRPDLAISIELPEDLTKDDAEMLCSWLSQKVSTRWGAVC